MMRWLRELVMRWLRELVKWAYLSTYAKGRSC